MTNKEAISILEALMEDIYIREDSMAYIERNLKALGLAVKALKNSGTTKIEITEVHTFARPEDTNDLKFGD